jgi:hypothetical protein
VLDQPRYPRPDAKVVLKKRREFTNVRLAARSAQARL